MNFTNLLDLEEMARARMDATAFDYIAGGSDDEVTLRENRAAFAKWRLRPRYLVDVSQPDLSTTVLGQHIAMPVLIAPSAYHKLAHLDGELATARAAKEVGTIMVASTGSNYSITDIAREGARLWFQLYTYKDRRVTEALIEMAVAAGAQALCLSIDVPALGNRERDVRNNFVLPEGLTMANLAAVSHNAAMSATGASWRSYSALWDASLTWDVIGWLRERSGLPVVVKGVMSGEDAAQAVAAGAAAVIVSNHGGRQLDSLPATLDVLPEVVEAVAGRVEVLLDGGVRRGTDVLKAIALGAKAVLLGRPIIWGLAIGGGAGATAVLTTLRDEITRDMMLLGRPRIADVDRTLLREAR